MEGCHFDSKKSGVPKNGRDITLDEVDRVTVNEIRSGMNQVRDNQGRFHPGTSGNPSGRPPGITDKRVALKKQLLEPLLPEAIDKLAEAVSKGERWAIELVVTYSLPKPKPVDPDELAEFEERLSQLEQTANQH